MSETIQFSEVVAANEKWFRTLGVSKTLLEKQKLKWGDQKGEWKSWAAEWMSHAEAALAKKKLKAAMSLYALARFPILGSAETLIAYGKQREIFTRMSSKSNSFKGEMILTVETGSKVKRTDRTQQGKTTEGVLQFVEVPMDIYYSGHPYKPIVLLIGGIYANRMGLGSWANQLSEALECIVAVVDLPGTENSPVYLDQHNSVFFSEVLLQIKRKLHGSYATFVVGFDFGGAIATSLAHQGRVDGAVHVTGAMYELAWLHESLSAEVLHSLKSSMGNTKLEKLPEFLKIASWAEGVGTSPCMFLTSEKAAKADVLRGHPHYFVKLGFESAIEKSTFLVPRVSRFFSQNLPRTKSNSSTSLFLSNAVLSEVK